VIFEIRSDHDGEFCHLITAWKATSMKRKPMPIESKPSPSPDEVAEMSTRGEDVSRFFTNEFKIVKPVHRVNVDLSQEMLRELDARAARLNISRQAVIKTLLRQVLDQTSPRPSTSKRRAG